MASQETKRLGVVIGKFNPCHKFHISEVIAPAIINSDKVLILLGSANRAPNNKIPFNFKQRQEIINLSIADYFNEDANVLNRIYYEPLYDTNSNESWAILAESIVNDLCRALERADRCKYEIVLYGTKSDASSEYLELFTSWKHSFGKVAEHYHATDLRNMMYEDNPEWENYLSPAVVSFMKEKFIGTDHFAKMKSEHEFVKNYRSQFEKPNWLNGDVVGFFDKFVEFFKEGWDALPLSDKFDKAFPNLVNNLHNIATGLNRYNKQSFYPPYFITTDAVIIQRGKILLIKRGQQPGKGLWALPGGFVGANEYLIDSCLREVKEETKVTLEKSWLKDTRVFDAPGRSLRGRTVTHAFLFVVPESVFGGKWEKIANIVNAEGADDAATAGWFPLSEVLNNDEYAASFFEDHHDIISRMAKSL